MGTKTIIGSTIAFALCGLTGPAAAQEEDFQEGYEEGYEEGAGEPVVEERAPMASFTLGGGVSSFTREDVRDRTGTAGNWEVRALFGTSLPFGVEAAYIGSAQSVDAIGLDEDAVLLGNGLEGGIRVQLPLVVSPYAAVGLAWRHYEIVNADTNTSDIEDEDDVLEVPLSLGVGFNRFGASFDLRGTYRHAFNDEMMGGNTDELDDVGDVGDIGDSEPGDLHRIGVNLSVGVAF